MLIPIILAGGSGTRLWPLSRAHYPKQLIPLMDGQSLLQKTLSRIASIPEIAAPIVVCNEAYRFMIQEQLTELGIMDPTILLEPAARNTAAAITVASLYAKQISEDAVLLVLPADHVIEDETTFSNTVSAMYKNVEKSKLLCFGVAPTSAHTGYGYLKAGGLLTATTATPISEFVEKPTQTLAETYLSAGDHCWNSGMFLFHVDAVHTELSRHMPNLLSHCQRALKMSTRDKNFVRVDKNEFEQCESISFDYAIMEKTANAQMVSLDVGWSDVGSWSALWDISEKDSDDNVLSGDVVTHNVTNSYVRSNGRCVAVVGLDNCLVVETKDAVLVASKDKAEDIKMIVNKLNDEQREEALLHKKVFRPWGSFETIDESSRFKAKRLTVNAGASISLQMHHHRSEHWIVVRGTAKVTKGDDVDVLYENQSTYIPTGIKHRLENIGKIPLEIIEVQTGSYLGEDDIIRFEDRYDREKVSS